MHKLHELKEMLCDELETYGAKGKLDANSLEIVDKLAHAIKNIDKILEGGEYSNYYMDGRSYTDGRNYTDGRSYTDGSYRGRKRDSMGRYASEGYSRAHEDIVHELRGMMDDVRDEHTRQEFKNFIKKLEMA